MEFKGNPEHLKILQKAIEKKYIPIWNHFYIKLLKKMEKANLEGINLEKVKLKGIVLEGANLKKAILKKSESKGS